MTGGRRAPRAPPLYNVRPIRASIYRSNLSGGGTSLRPKPTEDAWRIINNDDRISVKLCSRLNAFSLFLLLHCILTGGNIDARRSERRATSVFFLKIANHIISDSVRIADIFKFSHHMCIPPPQDCMSRLGHKGSLRPGVGILEVYAVERGVRAHLSAHYVHAYEGK